MPTLSSSQLRPRHTAVALAFFLSMGAAHAAPVAQVHDAAQAQQQGVLDTMRDLVNIESGSKDPAGVARIAALVAERLKEQGGKSRSSPPRISSAWTTRPRRSARWCMPNLPAPVPARSC